jgi:predicted ATP-grasp superfamily ATP-dependent carboligase
MLAPARYSRFVEERLTCPPYEQTDAWTEWLLAVGQSGPRRAVYATSDDVSFALALHRDALSPFFDLYQPDLATMMSVLDKAQLLDHARAVGIDVPETWQPRSREDVERIARDVEGPLLVKPRTQVSTRTHMKTKGTVCHQGGPALLAAYDQFVDTVIYSEDFTRMFPEATRPLIQAYHPEAMEAIYSLAGFRDASGEHVAMLGANKVLQRPRRLGVGLCFEGAPVDPDLAARVTRLCERIGYYGVFELEFIRCGGRSLLIDLNARFYNQIVFDIARGMDLPRMAYAAATGKDDEVARLVTGVRGDAEKISMAFCNGIGFEVTIGMQRIFGAMTRREAETWHRWRSDPKRKVVDAVADDDDPMPFACDVAQQVWQCVRHPRAFVRQLGLAQ